MARVTTVYKTSGPKLNLGELRALVKLSEGAPDEASVTVTSGGGDMRDTWPATITVTILNDDRVNGK